MPSEYKGNKPEMKYLFSAFFSDGTTIRQTKADQSKYDPTKSCFTDVLRYQEAYQLQRFCLNSANNFGGIMGHEYSIDLKTGLFSIDGVEFSVAEQNFIPEAPLKLIYFRETRLEVDVNSDTREVQEERFYINRYFIGWETIWKNKKYQCTIAIDGK